MLEELGWALGSRGLPRLSESEVERLLSGAEELARDAAGPTALRSGSLVVKLFRLTTLLSSQAWSPLSRRFVRNARGLRERGIASVEAEGPWVAELPRVHVVTYPWLAGRTLREVAAGPGRDEALLALALLISRLHEQGIIFRSLHFANVLVLDSGGLALVDVADVVFRNGPLSLSERLRSARHLGRYREDVEALRAFGLARFADACMGKWGGDVPATFCSGLEGLAPRK